MVITSTKTVTTIPYSTITNITFERRRQSDWSPLTGRLGNGTQNWLTITHRDLTTGGYYTLRMSDVVLNRLLGNLEARSGHTIIRSGG